MESLKPQYFEATHKQEVERGRQVPPPPQIDRQVVMFLR